MKLKCVRFLLSDRAYLLKKDPIELVGVPLDTLVLVSFLVGVGFQLSFSLPALPEELIFSSNSLMIDLDESFSGVRVLANGFRRVAVIGIVDGVKLHEFSSTDCVFACLVVVPVQVMSTSA